MLFIFTLTSIWVWDFRMDSSSNRRSKIKTLADVWSEITIPKTVPQMTKPIVSGSLKRSDLNCNVWYTLVEGFFRSIHIHPELYSPEIVLLFRHSKRAWLKVLQSQNSGEENDPRFKIKSLSTIDGLDILLFHWSYLTGLVSSTNLKSHQTVSNYD